MDEAAILAALKQVQDPDLHKDVVTLGFIKNLTIEGSTVSFTLELTTPACPVKEQLKQQAHDVVLALDGVETVQVELTAQVSAGGKSDSPVLPTVKNVIAIASGKGGVGKSTVSANLAIALSELGARVGLLDADIYGPSQPTMFGTSQYPEVTPDKKIKPVKAHGIEMMSIGLISDPKKAVIWRGPMVHGVLQQFLNDILWSELDYLLIDMPPGTGDAQLTLTQLCPLAGAIIVTTPQEVSLIDARKGLGMFQTVNVPILGIIENMSYFECSCGEKTHIFKKGGGPKDAEELHVPFLGEIPMQASVAEAGDSGTPQVAQDTDSPASKAFLDIAGAVAAQISIANLTAPQAPKINL